MPKLSTKDTGRIETRECWVTDKEEYLSLIRKRQQWKGLKSIIRIVSQRQSLKGRSTNPIFSSPVCPLMQKQFWKPSVAIGKSKPVALGLGYRLSRRWKPCSQRSCCWKSGSPSPCGFELTQKREDCQRRYPCQTLTGWLEQWLLACYSQKLKCDCLD